MTPLLGILAVAVAAPTNWHPAPPAVARALDAAREREVLVDPQRRWAVEVSAPALGTLADPDMVPLAGLRLDPARHLPAGLGGADLVRVWPLEGEPITVPLPSAEGWLDPQLSPDGSGLLLTRVTGDGLALWLVDTESWTPRQLTQPVLHRVTGPACAWLAPGEGWICKVEAGSLREHDGPVEAGPRILGEGAPPAPSLSQASLGERFRAQLASQLVWIRPDLQVARIGDAALWVRVLPSPDGRWLATERWKGPFTEEDVVERLPRQVALLDRLGQRAATLEPASPPEISAMGAVPTGARQLAWRPDLPATLTWVEAADGGDPSAEQETRDVVHAWSAPFTEPSRVLWRGTRRFGGLYWASSQLAVLTEWWWADRSLLQWRLDPSRLDATGVAWTEQTGDDDPGTWITDGRGQLEQANNGDLWRRRRARAGAAGLLQRIEPNSGRVRLERTITAGHQPVMLLDNEGRSWVESDEQGGWWIVEGRRRRAWLPPVGETVAATSLLDGAATWIPATGAPALATLVWVTESDRSPSSLNGATPRWLAHAGVSVLELPLARLDRLEEAIEAIGLDTKLVIGGHGAGAAAALEQATHDPRFVGVIARSGSYRGADGRLASWLDDLSVPVLWIHGREDARSGFGVAQARVAFELVRSRGTTVRWVELPDEDHGYRRRPSVEHVLWEMQVWMERWAAGGAG